MEERVGTVAGLVDAITVEMERLAYKPSVIKQYHIVWDKLCAHSGGMPAEEFTVESGMGFLEEVESPRRVRRLDSFVMERKV